MKREKMDRMAGVVYFRAVAVVCLLVAPLLLAEGLWILLRGKSWGGLFWLAGALLFGLLGRNMWRKPRRLSDIAW